MAYTLHKNIRDIAVIRNSFLALAGRVFGLSFRKWYEDGYWTDRYRPYVLLDGDRVVSCVAVNRIELAWQDRPKRYIQLGTVMTDPAYRRRGLSRGLIETVLEEWRERCEVVYLFANDTVLDFYPKFGFERELEYQPAVPVMPCPGKYRKLDLADRADLAILAACYRHSNPYAAFSMTDNFALLMFYCSDGLKDCVYFLEEFDMVVIAGWNDRKWTCFDLYGPGSLPLGDLLAMTAEPSVKEVILGFTPKETVAGMTGCRRSEPLFLLSDKENLFRENRLMFPLLSHA